MDPEKRLAHNGGRQQTGIPPNPDGHVSDDIHIYGYNALSGLTAGMGAIQIPS